MCNKCYSTIDKQVLSFERYDLYDEDETEQSDMGYDFDFLDSRLDN
jgi:hypothetical protein